MPLIFLYLIKLSVSLAIMYFFYQFVLRRLTFYNHNRWYLLVYSLLCFFIPLINVSPVLEKNEVVNTGLVTYIPAIEKITAGVSQDAGLAETPGGWTIWTWLTALFVLGVMLLLLRLVIQFFSFRIIKRKAKLIEDGAIRFYQVEKNIIPFSFGNSIFINQKLHTAAELKEIMRHEFVHVKQHHTLDIIWAEILCILNWYNPCAWLIKKAIRQNLEFIADNNVLQNGADKKEYQYLLIKVIGNNHFRIASNFNFSSIKKRIAMMNKIRSAKVNLVKFLFVVPLLAIVLLSFRRSQLVARDNAVFSMRALPVFNDTVPHQTTQNSKGYYIDIKDNKGNCMVVVKDKNKKEVKKLLLTEWNKKEIYYEDLYGEILSRISSPPVPTIEAKPHASPSPVKLSTPSAPPTQAMPVKLPVDLKNKAFDNNSNKHKIIQSGIPANALYYLNGKQTSKEAIDLLDPDKIKSIDVLMDSKAEQKYGEKGKNGVIEIRTVTYPEANFIEKRNSPDWDIKNFLAGKKKDEC